MGKQRRERWVKFEEMYGMERRKFFDRINLI